MKSVNDGLQNGCPEKLCDGLPIYSKVADLGMKLY